jgi:hypothetical protein
MGEKGNLESLGSIGGATSAATTGLAQRAASMSASAATDLTVQIGDTLKDKVVGAVVDETVAEGRSRLVGKDLPPVVAPDVP